MDLRDDPHRDPGCAWIYLPGWRRRWLPWHHSRGRCPSLGGRRQQDRHSGTWLRHGVVADGVEGRGGTEAAAARCSLALGICSEWIRRCSRKVTRCSRRRLP
ncbi:unnamed protein product [Symbiodinium sp. KB8]|nr:unnamed protein product [Symbiodinium sp. KB8]